MYWLWIPYLFAGPWPWALPQFHAACPSASLSAILSGDNNFCRHLLTFSFSAVFVWGYIFRLWDFLLIMYAKYDTAALPHLLFYSQKVLQTKICAEHVYYVSEVLTTGPASPGSRPLKSSNISTYWVFTIGMLGGFIDYNLTQNQFFQVCFVQILH